jgi:hypothetical protein
MPIPNIVPACHTPRQFWSRHREATLNWIALGLLLAAWNASDQDHTRVDECRPCAAKGHKSVNTL